MGDNIERFRFALQHLVPIVNVPILQVGAAAADYSLLPAEVLRAIAGLAVAVTESAMLGKMTRCARCQQHVNLRCECVRDGEYWPEERMERSISACSLGQSIPKLTTEHVQAYRGELLGAVQSIRLVSRLWRDAVG